MNERPSWDEVWLNVARDVARRSRCVASQVGCVIVSLANTAAAVSYNGPPAQFRAAANVDEMCDIWCPHSRDPNGGRTDYLDCVSSHAEANGLMQADRRLIAGGTIYVTRMPCFMCAKMIANSGLARVVAMKSADDDDRPTNLSYGILQRSGLEVEMRYVATR